MHALQSSQRLAQRKSPSVDPSPVAMPPPPGTASVMPTSGPRNSSGSARSSTNPKKNPSQQLSQIEKSVTHLLIATKQLLETLTQWSRHTATEGEVSDVYVRLGYEFNIACRAFNGIGVDTSDLGPVPDLLRAILEDTLSQEASSASLDKFLPRIRDIIINLLHGLKRKQQRLRSRQAKGDSLAGQNGSASRQLSISSNGSGETGITTMLEDAQKSYQPTTRAPERRTGGGNNVLTEDPGVPPRTSSAQATVTSPTREESGAQIVEPSGRSSNRDTRPFPPSLSESSLSSTTMQALPVLSPEEYRLPIQRISTYEDQMASPHPPPPPPPPPKQQDALAQLQRGGELERRASRRYSAYQISKHLGASPSGLPMLPPAQNSPIPNRGRDVRESLNAVRNRGSLLSSQAKATSRFGNLSPSRSNALSRRISEESHQSSDTGSKRHPSEPRPNDSPLTRTPEDKLGPSFIDVNGIDQPALGATLNGPPSSDMDIMLQYPDPEDHEPVPSRFTQTRESPRFAHEVQQPTTTATTPAGEFVAEQSPQPGKELTLFLQYKSNIKKFILPDGSTDLSMARLQLAFIEKFAWNTHNNGNDLPEIYIQDPVSGIRHELEDLGDVKDRSVLVLNVEVLDEVKRHIDDGLGGLRRMVEGVRTVVDGQQAVIQHISDHQQESVKEMARIAATPQLTPTRANYSERQLTNGVRPSTSTAEASVQLSEIQSLRRDLAVVRQSFSTFTTGITSSMTSIRAKASSVKSVALDLTIPRLDGNTGRAYVNGGKKTVGEESETIVNRVDDLQDLVEDLRKDVVTRGVRPLPRQLETVSKDISSATAELKKMQEYLKREKPVWTKIWEKELETVCNDREFLTMQDELVADLEDDLEKATQTFALVEQATKQQNIQHSSGTAVTLRSTSRGLIAVDQEVDPMKAKDGVLGEVRALQPNHETRLEAIERAEKARQKELEGRREGAFKKELGSFVEEGKLKKSGGVEEAERLRKAKDERNRREAWEKQQSRQAGKGKEVETPDPNGSSANGKEPILNAELNSAIESLEEHPITGEPPPDAGESLD